MLSLDNKTKQDRKYIRPILIVSFLLILVLVTTSCGKNSGTKQGGSKNLSGAVKIDGSSTVGPISEAIAEEFMASNPNVRVTVGISGTGGGFKKFVSGEIDISDASRKIETQEIEQAKKNGIEYLEIPIAYDGISILVNKNNNWADSITVEELKKIWEPQSKINNWNQINPAWPNKPLKLYGPGTDSGTFDYFTKEINGVEKASRTDYFASEDDNVLVQGISSDEGALGYIGYAYYFENKDKLKVLAVDTGNGPVVPSDETIKNNAYKPLSRPLFIYINKAALKRPEVKAFVEFFLTDGKELISEVGYIPLSDQDYDKLLTLIK